MKFEKFTRKKSEELINFLLSESWKFHGTPNLKRKEIEENISKRYYTKRSQITFLVKNENKTLIGILRIYDLKNEEDEFPLFDIRLGSKYRGKGFGEEILKFMIKYIFENYPKIRRIEGSTREDNFAMQKLFEKVGFVKVAQFRKSWPDNNGNWYDSLTYDLLREEINDIST